MIWLQVFVDALFTLLVIVVPPTLSGHPFGVGAVVAGVVGGAIYSLAMYVFFFRPRMRSLR